MSVAHQVMYCLRLTPWERREPPAPHWDLTSSRPASEITLNGPVRSAWATWYRLTRQ
jgi:hypothetical protein